MEEANELSGEEFDRDLLHQTIEEIAKERDPIIEGIIAMLSVDPVLKIIVRVWERVNGIIPGKACTICVGWENERFDEYDRQRDEANQIYKIWLKRDDKNISRGEAINRILARRIRNILSRDYTLGGVVPISFVRSIEALYADGSDQVHISTLTLEVKTYAKRF